MTIYIVKNSLNTQVASVRFSNNTVNTSVIYKLFTSCGCHLGQFSMNKNALIIIFIFNYQKHK